MRASVAFGLGIAVLLGGCGHSAPANCDGNCPGIADSFSMDYTNAVGACSFTAPIVPPTLLITQTPGDNRASFGLVDPVNQTTFDLPATVSIPASDGSTVATLYGLSRVQRQARLGDPRLLDLQIIVEAAVTNSGGRRRIVGEILTQDLTATTPDGGASEDVGCQQILQFIGTGGPAQ